MTLKTTNLNEQRKTEDSKMTRGKNLLGNDGLAKEKMPAGSAGTLSKKSTYEIAANEEFMTTFDNLFRKLPLCLIEPLVDFIVFAGIEYTPCDADKKRIRSAVEESITHAIIRQLDPEAGRDEPIETIEGMCQMGIIASHLGIHYDLEPQDLGMYYDLIMEHPSLNRDIRYILNFELHHFNYKDGLGGDLDFLETFLPLDIIYFAQLNGFAGYLESHIIGELDEHVKAREFRYASEDEARAHLAKMKKEAGYPGDCNLTPIYGALEADDPRLEYWGELGEKKILRLEYELGMAPETHLSAGTISALKKLLGEKDFSWVDSNGITLIYPPGEEKFSRGRESHSMSQIRKYLGADLETALAKRCEENRPISYGKMTEILYRRNRVKAFLGGDIKIPRELARHDDAELSAIDPKKITDWIERMVANWGAYDIGSELNLPLTLTKTEYRMFRAIKLAMEYVKEGELSYDTPEKRQLLARSGEYLSGMPSLLLLGADPASE